MSDEVEDQLDDIPQGERPTPFGRTLVVRARVTVPRLQSPETVVEPQPRQRPVRRRDHQNEVAEECALGRPLRPAQYGLGECHLIPDDAATGDAATGDAVIGDAVTASVISGMM